MVYGHDVKGGNVINTVIVYGVARTDENGDTVLESELYADEMLAQEACKQPSDTDVIYTDSVVWQFTLIRNCVKSQKDAVEFFLDLNGAEAEVLLAASTSQVA